MILTVTPNAALDVTYRVGTLVPHGVHRVADVRALAGGKGINVSSVAAIMGFETCVTGLVGGATGERIVDDLRQRGLHADFAPAEGTSRQTVNVVSDDAGDATIFNEAGPHQGEAAWQGLRERVVSLVETTGARVVVLAGSLPPGLPADAYAHLARAVAEAGAYVIVDADGHALTQALAGGPGLIKPNVAELERVTGTDDVRSGVSRLRASGAADVVVSAGADGLVHAPAEGAWVRARLRTSLRGNPTGAGDAAVAAFAAARVAGWDAERAVVEAVAWSAAAVLQPQAGVVDPSDVAELRPHVECEEYS